MSNTIPLNLQQHYFVLHDSENKPNIIISGNAHHSLIPSEKSNPKPGGIKSNTSRRLLDALQNPIKVNGLLTYSNFDIGLGKKCNVTFACCTDVRMYYMILGMDFITENNLVVDFETNTVTNPQNDKTVTGITLDAIDKQLLYPAYAYVTTDESDPSDRSSSARRPLVIPNNNL